MSKRVVITGYGCFMPIGKNVDEMWKNLKNGEISIRELDQELIDNTGVKFASKFKDYDPKNYFSKKEIRTYDEVMQYAVLSAREASKMANLDEVQDRTRIGVNMTSGIGGFKTIENEAFKACEKGYNKIAPMFIPRSIVNLVAGNVAIDQNATGICNSLVTACSSSTDAIGHAKMYIESDFADIMITGGSEATVTNIGLAGFKNIGALSRNEELEKACIPFDRDRSGFVMGEGSTSLILEEYEHAKKRGATIYGEVTGYFSTCDASHITAPDPEGKGGMRAIENSLKQSSIKPEEVALINAHGTSTPANEATEAVVYGQIFGTKVPITSTKSQTGHMLGGTGAFEALATLLSLNDRIITRTIGTQKIDFDNIDVCIGENRKIRGNYGLSMTLAFGGHNSVVVLKGREDNE